ncbi:ribonuclease Y [Microlunatus sp. Gsoil 973]|uniref:ribonuclease Y n=1 Tax=Microlunatus sp. Gsoil 973 TaxID=2672569 RepID=UPI0012B4E106|nr:ribonuclease Y [Microlunatus sp. Gsoil 973]QGN33049.1 ribonuclease Y [Microlunatus sp. Gsoil 973]
MPNLFEVLVLFGLVVLIALASVAVFSRRHRPVGRQSATGSGDDQTGQQTEQARSQADEVRAEADAYDRETRGRAEVLLREAQTARGEVRTARAELDRREQRLTERETRLDDEGKALHDRAQRLDQLESDLVARNEALAAADSDRQQELERVSGLTAEQAKAELLATVEHDAKRQAMILARDIETTARREAEDRAREIVISAIQRVASDQTAESVVSAVHLPGDDMKGRIIGREGRNIRSFEQVTGVNVLIDDTPESVLLSSFDPVRRETARITLIELIEDGRIHPARIEEVHERSKSKIAERVMRAAEDALAEVGISDLHPDLVPIVGTLRYRTSYGQNVLKHLVESAHIAGLMAAELHLDVATVKRAAFLHDIGKALTHEVEGSHALIGADLARRYGEHPDIVHAIEAHHNEVEPTTVEAVLTQAADAISGGRPGARRESLEAYVKRLERLEQIAQAHEGVEKVFAMQAGRELRVMVAPDVVDDIEAQVLARDIAKQIEEELTYPGQIKVSVIRESRAVETAR